MNKIIYLDAAASALKPESVITAQMDFLRNSYANAGRGVCARATAVDDMIAHARARVARFINADTNQVIFTSGATDGLNRVVNIITQQPSWTNNATIGVSDLDHHSARMPWAALLHNGKIRKMFKCELDENMDIKIDGVPCVDVLVITAMSNVFGRPQDVHAIIAAARKKNPQVITIVDASQYVVHNTIDVKKWDCDFLVFSGHKIGADTGVGILYIRDSEKYFPDKFGGGMVSRVGDIDAARNASYGAWIYENAPESCWITAHSPDKWEAGTLPITQIIGLEPAIDSIESKRPDINLIKYMYDKLSQNTHIKILSHRDAALLTFVVDKIHVLDFGVMVGARGLCVRVGNMCSAWAVRAAGTDGVVRISVGNYNTPADADAAVQIINGVVGDYD